MLCCDKAKYFLPVCIKAESPNLVLVILDCVKVAYLCFTFMISYAVIRIRSRELKGAINSNSICLENLLYSSIISKRVDGTDFGCVRIQFLIVFKCITIGGIIQGQFLFTYSRQWKVRVQPFFVCFSQCNFSNVYFTNEPRGALPLWQLL